MTKINIIESITYNYDHSSAYECLMCGGRMEYPGRFCSEKCADDYDYVNRTCSICGGEFWDGGHSCTCEEEKT